MNTVVLKSRNEPLLRFKSISGAKSTKALRERKPPPTPIKIQPIQDSNPDCRINSDMDRDVCRICPKMLWMHYRRRQSFS